MSASRTSISPVGAATTSVSPLGTRTALPAKSSTACADMTTHSAASAAPTRLPFNGRRVWHENVTGPAQARAAAFPVALTDALPAARLLAAVATTLVGNRKYDSAGINTNAPIMFHTNMKV